MTQTIGQLRSELAKCRTQRNELLQTEKGNLPAWVVSVTLSEVLDLTQDILNAYKIESEHYNEGEVDRWEKTIAEYRTMV